MIQGLTVDFVWLRERDRELLDGHAVGLADLELDLVFVGKEDAHVEVILLEEEELVRWVFVSEERLVAVEKRRRQRLSLVAVVADEEQPLLAGQWVVSVRVEPSVAEVHGMEAFLLLLALLLAEVVVSSRVEDASLEVVVL